MKKRFQVALVYSEEGEKMYMVFDAEKSLLAQDYKYFTNRKKAIAEQNRLNSVFGKKK